MNASSNKNRRRVDRRPPPPGRMVEVKGIKIHVEQRGQGPDMLLLHGYLASTFLWHSVFDGLAHLGRTTALDFPGCGYSDRPAEAPYTLSWLADMAERTADTLALDRPVLLAHSLGGAVALHAAARWPEKWRGLVLISPLVFQPPPPPGLRLAKKHPRAMRLFFESGPGRLLVSRLLRRAVYAVDGVQARASARHLLNTLDAPGGWEAATRIGLQAHDESPGQEILSRVTLPCLVIWGERDRSHPPELGEKLIRSLGGPSHLAILPRLGHNCHEEDPQAFLRLVKEFWNEFTASDNPDTCRKTLWGGRSTRQTY